MPYVVRDGQSVTWCSETKSGPWDQQQSRARKTKYLRRKSRRQLALAQRWNTLNGTMLSSLGRACFRWSINRTTEVK